MPFPKGVDVQQNRECFLVMLIQSTVRATTIEAEVIVQQGYMVGYRGKDGEENGCKIV